MEKLETKINYISKSSVMIIKKDLDQYTSYILKYDGIIFEDVEIADAKKFISQFPNIKNQLEENISYCLIYNFKYHKYQSSIILSNEKIMNKTLNQTLNQNLSQALMQILNQEKILENFNTLGDTILESMVELEYKISDEYIKTKLLEKKIG